MSKDMPREAPLRYYSCRVKNSYTRLTADQQMTLMAWAAACERVDQGLMPSPGYPKLNSDEMSAAMDVAIAALEGLRRAFCRPSGSESSLES